MPTFRQVRKQFLQSKIDLGAQYPGKRVTDHDVAKNVICDKRKRIMKKKRKEQGRIHGHQLRTGGHGYARFPGQTDGQTDGPTDGPTDGRTKPHIELRVRN